jgi:U3 small nucleolar RNA-associated protein 19
MAAAKRASENEMVIQAWLRERQREYVKTLLDWVRSRPLEEQERSLKLLMQLLKVELENAKAHAAGNWRTGIFGSLLQALVDAEPGEQIRKVFVEHYVERYDDVAFQLFMAMR